MKLIGILVALLGLVNSARAAVTAQVSVPVQQLPSVAGAWVEGSMLEGAGVKEVTQVGVHPGEKAEGSLVPARIDAQKGGYRVLWQVPGLKKGQTVGMAEKFTIELGGKEVTPSPKLAADETNLVDNGNFETMDATGRPAGVWSTGYFDGHFRVDQEKGNHFVSFKPDPTGNGPAFVTFPIWVQGGGNYVASYRYRISGAKAHPRYNLDLYGWVYFLDAEMKPLSPPRLSAGVFKTDSDGWERFETTIVMPKGAVYTRLQIQNGNTVPYATAIDDLRVAPAALTEVTSLETASKKKIELTVQSSDIRRFDLGPAGSPVWTGFTALTSADQYSADKKFGFTRLIVPTAMDTVRPEALTRDFITARDARLRVDLPKGQYQVWLITGDSQVGSTVQRLYFDSQLSINGQEVIKSEETPAAYFGKDGDYWRFYKAFWEPGMDYYDTFVAPHFQTRTFKAEVTDDHLEIDWRNLPVNAIVIASADQAQAMEGEMAALAGRRRRATQINQTPDPVEPMPKLTDADQHRGFVLFRREANEIVYPSSRPRAGEEISELKAFATPGQGETVHFSLLPLKDLGAVNVTAGDLSDGANTIPASAIDVRVARYIFKEAGQSRQTRGDYNYQIAPFPLDHHPGGVSGKTGVTWSWWTTIRVPEKTPAGVYRGELTIQSGSGEAFKLPVQLRIVPIQLDPLPIVQGYYYFPSEPWYSTFWGANLYGPSYRNDPAIRKIITDQETSNFTFMKDLGLNSTSFGDDLRGDFEYVDGQIKLKKDSRFIFWMDLYAKAGMGPMPFYGFQPIGLANRLGAWFPKELKQPFTEKWDAAYRSVVTNIQEIGKEHGWPEILWYISDEASNEGQKGAELALKLAKLLEGMKGVKTIASMNGPWEHILPPHLTISMPNIAFPITEQTIKLIRDSGSKLWLYNCGDSRLMLGLYPWRVDAGGRFQWHYRYMVANPWDDLDGSSADSTYSISLASPDGIVPCMPAETVRAAINDHRYIVTLERAIAAAKDQADKQKTVAQAKAFLEDLRSRIPVDGRVLSGYKIDPRAVGAETGGEFKNTDALDRVRWAAAEYILQLSK